MPAKAVGEAGDQGDQCQQADLKCVGLVEFHKRFDFVFITIFSYELVLASERRSFGGISFLFLAFLCTNEKTPPMAGFDGLRFFIAGLYSADFFDEIHDWLQCRRDVHHLILGGHDAPNARRRLFAFRRQRHPVKENLPRETAIEK